MSQNIVRLFIFSQLFENIQAFLVQGHTKSGGLAHGITGEGSTCGLQGEGGEMTHPIGVHNP